MSDNSFDAAQKALRNRAVVDLEEPLPDEQPTRWWLWALIVLVFFGFGSVVWLSWQDNAGDGTPVMVAAPPGPTKEKPEDPGGMAPRNQDTTIADALDGGQGGQTVEPPPELGPLADSTPLDYPRAVEVIPPAEKAGQATAPDASTGAVSLDEIAPAAGRADGTTAIPGGEPPQVTRPVRAGPAEAGSPGLMVTPLPPVGGVPSAPVPPAAPSSTATAPAAPTPPAPVASLPAAGPRPIVPPAEPAPPSIDAASIPSVPGLPPVTEPAPEAVAPPPPSQSARGGVRIQVGSLRSEAAANTAWSRVQQRNEDVLEGMRRVIVRAEVKGVTYFRAQAEGFASRSAAQSACVRIKSRGTDCLVVNP